MAKRRKYAKKRKGSKKSYSKKRTYKRSTKRTYKKKSYRKGTGGNLTPEKAAASIVRIQDKSMNSIARVVKKLEYAQLKQVKKAKELSDAGINPQTVLSQIQPLLGGKDLILTQKM